MLKIKFLLEGFTFIKSCIKSKKGQAMTEYGLIIALIAVVLIVVLISLSDVLKELFDSIVAAIQDIVPDAED